MDRHDLVIVGAGPVGMTLALALKDAGLDIVLVDARPRGAARKDPRILALSHGTRLTLERLGIWTRLPATPIETIHVSHQGGLGRTVLQASEYGQPALGYVAGAGDLATALDDQGKPAEAEQEYRAALKIQERVLGAEHPDVAMSCFCLALCLKAQKKVPEALAFMQQSEQISTKIFGPDHPDAKAAKGGRQHLEAERQRLEAELKAKNAPPR